MKKKNRPDAERSKLYYVGFQENSFNALVLIGTGQPKRKKNLSRKLKRDHKV